MPLQFVFEYNIIQTSFRLKKWITEQAEREKEILEKRQKKLEKMCEEPKFEFKDEQYEKERSVLPEEVEDAVLQGLQASCSSKRKIEPETKKPKKKAKLWCVNIPS